MKYILNFLIVFASFFTCQAQFEKYSHVYPITEDANVRWLSSYSEYETIQAEANPIVKFSFYNNFVKRFADTTKLHSMAQYVDFRPQFRLYNENSKPIKTPCYRIFLGTQHMFRLHSNKPNTVQFVGFAVQSGHFSNGQSRCAFAEDENDSGGICNAVYDSITSSSDLSAMLNRRNGNFSVNLSEFTAQYRYNTIGLDNFAKRTHAVSLGYVIFHKGVFGIADFDLVSDNDLDIIGRHRLKFEYDFTQTFKLVKKSKVYQRVRFQQKVETIFGAHPHITPIRSETTLSFYPASVVSALGIAVSYIYGFDNYNYRIVDAGHQIGVGITWDLNPPVKLKNG